MGFLFFQFLDWKPEYIFPLFLKNYDPVMFEYALNLFLVLISELQNYVSMCEALLFCKFYFS